MLEKACDYTSFRLAHATPDHLHATSTTFFVGPIPHNWISTYEKKWYKRPRTNYHRKDITFARDDTLGNTNHSLSTCARWKAETQSTQITRAATMQSELNRDSLPAPDELTVISEASTDRAQVQLEANARSGLEAQYEIPASPRPALTIHSPPGLPASREQSSISQVSFATAQESFDETEDVETSGSSRAESPARDSDTETIRQPLTISAQLTPSVCLPEASSSQQSNDSQQSSGDPDRSGQASSIRSDQSLLKHNGQVPTKPLVKSRLAGLPGSHLVRFTSDFPSKVIADRSAGTFPICEEGAAIQRHNTERESRKQRGYFNQSMLRNPFRKPKQVGELLRAERMLIRTEFAPLGGVPVNYDENIAKRVKRRVESHWREFLVAARNDEHGHVVLTFHQHRAIPKIAQHVRQIKAAGKVIIDPLKTRCNLYSTLDKTIVLWTEAKKGTIIHILRPHTTHSSIEWYAFLQTTLGQRPAGVALVGVPSLGLRLSIDLKTKSGTDNDDDTDEALTLTSDDSASIDINDEGQIVTDGVPVTGEYLITACWRMLSRDKEWHAVLKDWKEHERMGLCWRRYDRLEWIHGADARQLIGQWSMAKTHELEFRPKEHYGTEIHLDNGQKMAEPAPIEGFLVRLTGSTGRQARFGKVFYKRLYFSSHDHLLNFAKPEASVPPPPPDFDPEDSERVGDSLRNSPITFMVDPYPVVDNRIAWLNDNVTHEERIAKSAVAMTEASRRVDQLHVSDGYIDLSKVKHIRRCKRMQVDVEENIDHTGSAVHFDHTDDDTENILLGENDGAVDEFDEQRVFELVLQSGLVIRLQAYDAETRIAWMQHLALLVKYWVRKLREEQRVFHQMKQANMETLKIDEEAESLVGQYANKWEVSNCVSEPRIYNYCPLSSCRTIALHGLLYRKPRIHSTFKKCQCVVSHGKLLVYNHFHYGSDGSIQNHIHHSRRQTIELRDCYIFSGMVTESDLLNNRDASDHIGPGRHSLPRLYNDGSTSQDEQESLCFVLWQSRKRVAITGTDKDDAKGNKVSRLGVAGKHMIYMTRSRQERDLWVQVISNEIERCYAVGTI